MSRMKDYLLDSYDHISGDCPVTDCLVCAVEKDGHERQQDDKEREAKQDYKELPWLKISKKAAKKRRVIH